MTQSAMKSIDMHCDTLMHAYFHHGEGADIYHMPEAMVDVRRLREGGALAQFFAIFVPSRWEDRDWHGREPVSQEEYIRRCVRILEQTIRAHGDAVAPALRAEDILSNRARGKLSAVLTMEDGGVVRGDMARLEWLYGLGVRALGLTWNYANCFGAPNSQDPAVMSAGLTPFGRDAVVRMQELGMLVDVSHLSDGGFRDVAALARRPFVATHSNCRALSPHPRNLTDEMIRALADRGGVMGLNFCPEFLTPAAAGRESRVEDLVAMARHEKRVGGIEVVAIGSDFDGIDGDLEIPDAARMPLLADGLSRGGFTDDEIDKILCGNVLRVIRDAIG